MRPHVSIITPTANREAFLPQIARCVASQQVDWEWLVLDDGAQPSAFMQQLAQRDSRVRYHWSPETTTIGAKRNAMLDHARGELIAHFDDDDYYAPHYLSGMVALLEDNGLDLVKLSEFYMYAPLTRFFGCMDLKARVGHHYTLTGNSVEHVQFHEKMQIGADFILFYGFSFVYRRALAVSVRFDDKNLCEDESFIRRLVEGNRKVSTVDDPTQSCLHLIHPASTSRCFSRHSIPPELLPTVFPGYEGYPLPLPDGIAR